jgi:hypothetical protein
VQLLTYFDLLSSNTALLVYIYQGQLDQMAPGGEEKAGGIDEEAGAQGHGDHPTREHQPRKGGGFL